MIYLQLFITFFKIGLFTFGGGYAMISLIQNEIVVKNQWIDAATFTDIIAVSQMTPGPIGINSATYVGYAASGTVWGAAVATIAVSLPSFIIILMITWLYTAFKKNRWFEAALKGIRPVVLGLIASAAILLVTRENFRDWTSWAIFIAAFIATQWGKLNPIIVIIVAGVAGYLIY
ncbi:MAG: chromate transporter [Bacteroidales bacterium]|nr:chromate transporter [Bacteroidales bacterium]MDD2426030.1 chromate transporter [Bacteroidales bacterium]MDD3990264.1 chromate transporter [Bacteroidales bacterium]MDD4638817.1 chromate transporter [Bacteroidales bacterium]